ncbi:hypothetical protein T11_4244 [Trichinella zimbabwensis]|uniref:Uncharacterized protein n=1 Tax=Trichinella zimbabwensis TaxID=268475 RepID=A0A0V1G8C8_9BILA|nr:hypothetical protein T11_4244 [Trichinella zimbabwensis]
MNFEIPSEEFIFWRTIFSSRNIQDYGRSKNGGS